MKTVTPKVFHLASTKLDQGGRQNFLDFHGISDWKTDAEDSGEELIEIAGRRCYQSWETETVSVSEKNANLSKVREGNLNYIGNILKVGHGSVLEHSSVTFAFENVSRVFTHEVVRHRLCAFSQESLRFVRPTSLDAYFPEIFQNLSNDPLSREQAQSLDFFLYNEDQEYYMRYIEKSNQCTVKEAVEVIFSQTVTRLEDVQAELINLLGMDQLIRTFGDKKKLQSAMRRLMPIGLSTGIIMTTNHRNWRHLIALRTSKGAEEEIRLVFLEVAKQLAERYPAIYQDMFDEDGEAVFKFGRV